MYSSNLRFRLEGAEVDAYRSRTLGQGYSRYRGPSFASGLPRNLVLGQNHWLAETLDVGLRSETLLLVVENFF